MTYLALLATELHQLGDQLRAASEDVGAASRELGHAPTERIGTALLDGAAAELGSGTAVALGRVCVVMADVDQLLRRLAEATEQASGGSA